MKAESCLHYVATPGYILAFSIRHNYFIIFTEEVLPLAYSTVFM